MPLNENKDKKTNYENKRTRFNMRSWAVYMCAINHHSRIVN